MVQATFRFVAQLRAITVLLTIAQFLHKALGHKECTTREWVMVELRPIDNNYIIILQLFLYFFFIKSTRDIAEYLDMILLR